MSGKSNPKVQRLASSIVKFLEDSISNNTIDSEEKESVEVAANIIKEAFGIESLPPSTNNLLQIFDLYEKTRERVTSSASSGPTETQIAEAEKLKSQGNVAVATKEYDKAIEFYTKALELVPNNKIYLSNRAAAYSQAGKHKEAAADALKAVEIDPGYAKAWSRLGHARYALGDAKGSMEAYEKGLKCEGGQTDVMNRGYQTASKKYREQNPEGSADSTPSSPPPSNQGGPAGGGMPDFSSILGSMGGAGRGGGAPDLSSILNNPMLMNMAQQMAQSGAFDGLMNNPRVQEMARSMMSGERSMDDLMNDPEMQNMARNFGAGRGGGNTGS